MKFVQKMMGFKPTAAAQPDPNDPKTQLIHSAIEAAVKELNTRAEKDTRVLRLDPDHLEKLKTALTPMLSENLDPNKVSANRLSGIVAKNLEYEVRKSSNPLNAGKTTISTESLEKIGKIMKEDIVKQQTVKKRRVAISDINEIKEIKSLTVAEIQENKRGNKKVEIAQRHEAKKDIP